MKGLTLRDRRTAAVLVGAVLPLVVGFGLLSRSGAAPVPAAASAPAAAGAPATVTPAPGPAPASPPVDPDAASAAEPAAPGPGGEVLRLVSQGRQRAVLVQDPPSGRPARALLVVLGPHALTASRSAADLRFDALRAQDWAVAYPSTLDGDWNAGACCGRPQREGVDDVRFLTDVRGLLLDRYGVAADEVALTGYSTGGQMAYRLVCEHPGYAQALLVVAGSLETDCAPRGALPPTLVVHGDADTTVPWEERGEPLRLIDFAPTPLVESFAGYRAAAGCSGERRDTRDGRLLLAYDRCANGATLTLAGMPGEGHGWDALRGSVYAERFLPGPLAL